MSVNSIILNPMSFPKSGNAPRPKKKDTQTPKTSPKNSDEFIPTEAQSRLRMRRAALEGISMGALGRNMPKETRARFDKALIPEGFSKITVDIGESAKGTSRKKVAKVAGIAAAASTTVAAIAMAPLTAAGFALGTSAIAAGVITGQFLGETLVSRSVARLGKLTRLLGGAAAVGLTTAITGIPIITLAGGVLTAALAKSVGTGVKNALVNRADAKEQIAQETFYQKQTEEVKANSDLAFHAGNSEFSFTTIDKNADDFLMANGAQLSLCSKELYHIAGPNPVSISRTYS